MTTHLRPRWPELKAREMAEHPDVFAAYEAFKSAVRAGERTNPNRPLIHVECPDDRPLFASEDEEHEYWGTHEMGDGFLGDVKLAPDELAIITRIRQRRGQQRTT